MREQLEIDRDGVRLRAEAAGRGRPVLFLHGFPESAAAWNVQLDALAPHARAVALDMRGYGRSDLPADWRAYRLAELIADVAAVIDRLGEPPVLVGHDWGGVVAWAFAAAASERLAHLVVINAPHPALLARRIADTPAQAAASGYIGELASPDAAGRIRQAGLESFWTSVFGSAHARGVRSLEDRRLSLEQWSRPGALEAMLSYYRANPVAALAAVGRVDVPVTVIWGLDDAVLLPCLLDGLERFAPQVTIDRRPGNTHWLPHEDPELVTYHVLRAAGALRPHMFSRHAADKM